LLYSVLEIIPESNSFLSSFISLEDVDVHIRKLREKIGENFIKTIKGVGYKFEVLTKN
tara:strand:+ start:6115 stop:6288 length:174 start_codon:yes stop_codon:yes gene_type:complete